MRYALTLVGCLAVAGLVKAQDDGVRVRAPFTAVDVDDNGVRVRAPFVNLWIGGDGNKANSPYGRSRQIYQPVAPPPQPRLPGVDVIEDLPEGHQAPPPGSPYTAQIVSASDFANYAPKHPGWHEVTLQHTYTNQPVPTRVWFPAARVQEVNVSRDELEFQYDDFEVEVRFQRNGTVEVVYDN